MTRIAEDHVLSPRMPVAIVGMSCRLPGNVTNTNRFWELLENRLTAHSEVPRTRFNVDGFFPPDEARGGYFISDDIHAFDNDFFGISNAEAKYMDPQQRNLLEVVFESIENAGLTLEDLAGSDAGSFVASFTHDHAVMQYKDPEGFSRYSATGLGPTLLSNRINHVFDLRGPSMTIDTACSSSSYCLHQACKALQDRECTTAIVAGANLIQTPETTLLMAKAGVLSSGSRCRTFCEDADGYGRADGVVSLCLKRLDDAERHNDPIHAVISGSVLGSNGKTAGVTAPSADAQVALLEKLLSRTRLSTDSIAFVECHGTGTFAGDAAEVEALSRLFHARTSLNPVLLGSVKTNLGHSEAVSGLTSVMKVALMLSKNRIPPSFGVDSLSPALKKAWPRLQVVTDNVDWPKDQPHRGIVNSFGYGGALGSIVLDAYENHSIFTPRSDEGRTIPIVTSEDNKAPSIFSPVRNTKLIPFSANTHLALQERYLNDVAAINSRNVAPSDSVGFLGSRRSHLACRGYMIANVDDYNRSPVTGDLQTLSHITTPPELPLCFVFTGQGAQNSQMGMELFERYSAFRDSMAHMDEVLQNLPHRPTWTLRDVICEPHETSLINRAEMAQPATTALQIALVELLESWDVVPKVVVGHSSGEIAAAFAAGKVTVAEAITAAYYRGYVNARSAVPGAMAAVALSKAMATQVIGDARVGEYVRIACMNSPSNVTISGDSDAVHALVKSLETQGVFARVLNTGGKAYHSHHMIALGPQLEELLTDALQRCPPSRYCTRPARFISSVTGTQKDGEFGAIYWRENMESPVLFHPAIETIMMSGHHHFIEIGPHSALSLPMEQIKAHLSLAPETSPYSASLQRKRAPIECLLNLAGRLFIYGSFSKFRELNSLGHERTNSKLLVQFSTYPWQYINGLHYEPKVSEAFRNRQFPHHELLGSRMFGSIKVHLSWRNQLSLSKVPWLTGHRIDNVTVLPAAAYVAMAIEAFRQTFPAGQQNAEPIRLDVELVSALVLRSEPVEVFTVLQQTPPYTDTTDSYEFMISSEQLDTSTLHARGYINRTEVSDPTEHSTSTPEIANFDRTRMSRWYGRLAEVGLDFNGQFKSLIGVRATDDSRPSRLHAAIDLKTKSNGIQTTASYACHPVDIDSLLQSIIIAASGGSPRDLEGKIPVSIRNIILIPAKVPLGGSQCSITATASSYGGFTEGDAKLLDEKHQPFLSIDRVLLTALSVNLLSDQPRPRQAVFDALWRLDRLTAPYRDSSPIESINEIPASSGDGIESSSSIIAGVVLDVVHKLAGTRILEVFDGFGSINMNQFNVLQNLSAGYVYEYFQGYRAQDTGEVFVNYEVILVDGKTEPATYSPPKACDFDVIILHEYFEPYADKRDWESLLDLVTGAAAVIAPKDLPSSSRRDETLGIRQAIWDLPNGTQLSLWCRHEPYESFPVLRNEMYLVDSRTSEQHATFMNNVVKEVERKERVIALDEISVPELQSCSTFLISSAHDIDLTKNGLFAKVQALVESASLIVWAITHDSSRHQDPPWSPVTALARSAMLERPSLSFVTYQIPANELNALQSVKNFLAVSARRSDIPNDTEFAQIGFEIHVSRLLPNPRESANFRQRSEQEMVMKKLEHAKPCRVEVPTSARMQDFFLVQDPAEQYENPPSGHIAMSIRETDLEFEGMRELVKATAKKYPTQGFTFERRGVVTKVAADVSRFKRGDAVTVLAPDLFRSNGVFPTWTCVKMINEENKRKQKLGPFVTALWILKQHFRMQAGERLLITEPASAEASAVIQIAKLLNIDVLILGKQPDKSLMSRGYDFVFNTSRSDPTQGTEYCASGGKYIALCAAELKHQPLLSRAKPEPTPYHYHLDWRELFAHCSEATTEIWQSLILEAKSLLDQGVVQGSDPTPIFDLADLGEAVQQLETSKDLDSVCISFEDNDSLRPTKLQPFSTRLSSTKSYLIIGGLGGIGRALIKWMISRGARNFITLSRSNNISAKVQSLIKKLTGRGAVIEMVQGDVTKSEDVEKAFTISSKPIGGIILAAMSLENALIQDMSPDTWERVLAPKVSGALNIQKILSANSHAIKHLDFLLFTSSVFGTVGGVANANYCAANNYLDALAKEARAQGIPAVSVGLGMISGAGYLAEHEKERELLSRSGLSQLTKDDMLHIIDMAISAASDPHGPSHILTGLEPSGLDDAKANGVELPGIYNDPRLSHLLRAHAASTPANVGSAAPSSFPEAYVEAIRSQMSTSAATASALCEQLKTMMQLSSAPVDLTKTLMSYGLDSMLATELKTWVWKAFGVDVPLFELLGGDRTILNLAGWIAERLTKT